MARCDGPATKDGTADTGAPENLLRPKQHAPTAARLSEVPYTKGLHEVADGVWAYLQPDGGWGWSNAGLVTGENASLLVDTLFDLRLTGEMLEAMRRVTAAAERIDTVVNTHANGDHCYGNALVADSRIIASARCAEEMAQLPASAMAGVVRAAPTLGPAGQFVARIFAPFSFDDIEAALPTATFDGRLDLSVAGRPVVLLEVGPAHTEGDVVVHLPDDGVVFTGDILFHGGHPIVWAGPVANWIAACERVLALDAPVIVPGHGPLATPSAVTDLKGYFEFLTTEARLRYDAGMSPLEAAQDIELGPYAGWSEGERVVANVRALYRDFGDESPADVVTVMGEMAVLAGFGDGSL
jgi:glyoxylase-like metal-dependent hydrolase (beta-lactamase superfamily II)